MALTAVATSLLVTVSYLMIAYSPNISPKAPPMIPSGNFPIVGALDFFRRRTDFFREHIRASAAGFFSFTVGKYHIVGISGAETRKKYFENRELSLNDGYAIMFSGPPTKSSKKKTSAGDGVDSNFSAWFSKRLLAMLKKENLDKVLEVLCGDTKDRLQDLVRQGSNMTDPFESVYRIVFQLTLRTVGCTELATDRARREK
ncbi:MAG: hypothetical protein INR71_11310, partial [Terriglobus roseus]|nr:hypothetical protein [Terriglobus roseus]